LNNLVYLEEVKNNEIKYIIGIFEENEIRLLDSYRDRMPYINDEVEEWLDNNTYGWEYYASLFFFEIIFQSKEDAILFKLTWG